MDIFIGAQVLELWSKVEVAGEQPLPVRLVERDVVFRVPRRVNHLEVELRRLKPFPGGSRLGGCRYTPGRLSVELGACLRRGDAGDSQRMSQRGDVKLLTDHAVIARMIFVVMGRDALAHSELTAQGRHLPGQVRRPRIYQRSEERRVGKECRS